MKKTKIILTILFLSFFMIAKSQYSINEKEKVDLLIDGKEVDLRNLFPWRHSTETDTTIKLETYTTIYSLNLKAPLLIYYKLYKGGGDCDRSKYHFLTGGVKTATDKDYDYHYDKGHLANSEDFSYNCKYDEMTFRYWNCYPQTPELNRGIWKSMETEVRKLSQTDSLLILIGGFYNNKVIGQGVNVPDQCWKVVYSLSKKTIIYCAIFTNTNKPERTDIKIDVLNSQLINKYKIDLNKFLK